MTELLLDVLLGLYPREWRDRYGGELRDLVRVLNEEHQRSLMGMVPSLIAGATVERLYAFRRVERAGVAALATVLVLGSLTLIGSHRHGVAAGYRSARRLGAPGRLARPPAPGDGSAEANPARGHAALGRSTL